MKRPDLKSRQNLKFPVVFKYICQALYERQKGNFRKGNFLVLPGGC